MALLSEKIIHCPTKELWDRVQKKMFEEGYEWCSSGKKFLNNWEIHKEKSCISMLEKYSSKMTYNRKPYLQKNYPSIPITPAEEYLGEFKVGDRVKILWEKSGYSKLNYYIDYGEIIRRTRNGRYQVKGFDPKELGYSLNFREEWLELLPNFSPGDRVRVKEEIELSETNCCPICNLLWVASMNEYKGEILTLKRKNSSGYWDTKEAGAWVFCEHWFEKVEEGNIYHKPNFPITYPGVDWAQDGTISYSNFKIINGISNKPIKKKSMKALILRKLSPSRRKLYKAGFIGDCNELTEQGVEVLMDIMAEKYEKDLVGVAEDVIKERKK